MPQELVWLNGQIGRVEDAKVHIEDRGNVFSDGIYEVAIFYDNQPFMLREHLERWEYSARGIMMESPRDLAWREGMIRDLVEQSGLGTCMAYGQLTRGVSRRNHLFPDAATTPPTEFWFVRAAPQHKPELFENGCALMSHPDERWAHCQYKTISLLPNVLAKERARRAGAYEALLYREDGTVSECTASNAYCVRGGVVYTHPLGPRILGGITRMAILRAAREAGIEVREQAVSLDQFRAADEAFISSTTMEVMPASRLDGQAIGSGKVGPVVRKLRDTVRDMVRAACFAGAAAG